MSPRTLIVGGAGFIGAALAADCLRAGEQVSILARPATNLFRLRDIADRIAIHLLEGGDDAGFLRILHEVAPEQVYYLAARTRTATRADFGDVISSIDTDLAMLIRHVTGLASLARPPRVFVRASSIAEYGTGPRPYAEHQREMPADSYAASLVAGTHYLQMMAPRLPFRIATARIGLVYGPAQSSTFLVPAIIRACLGGRSIEIRHPSARRDYVHLDDVVHAMRMIAAHPASPPILNISTGLAVRIADVAALIRDCIGASSAQMHLSASPGEAQIRELRASPVLAQTTIGWSARIAIEDGIRRLVKWERAHTHPEGVAA